MRRSHLAGNAQQIRGLNHQHGKVISVKLIAQPNAQVQEGPLRSREGPANLCLNSLQGFTDLSCITMSTLAHICVV